MNKNYTFSDEDVREMFRRCDEGPFDHFSSNWMYDDWLSWFEFEYKNMSVTVSLTGPRQESLKIYHGDITFFLDDVYDGMEYKEQGETNRIDFYDKDSLQVFAIQKIKEYFS